MYLAGSDAFSAVDIVQRDKKHLQMDSNRSPKGDLEDRLKKAFFVANRKARRGQER